MSYVFQINGISKTLLPGWKITETANGPNHFTGSIQSLDGTFRIAVDDVITLTESGTTIFAGLVDDPQEQGFGQSSGSGAIGGQSGSAAIVQAFTALDYNSYAARVAVTVDTARPSESLKARVTWIQGLLSAQSVTLSGTQATGPTLPAATYSAGQYLIDVLNATMTLANGTGSASWVWNIDYTLVLSAIQAGSVSAPVNVTQGDTNTAGDITVEQARPSTYANYDIVLGGQGTQAVTDNFTGNGSTVTFALNYPLSTSYGYVTVGGVFETLGTGATWSYSSSTNSITRTSAPGVGVAISINYIAQFPVKVIADGGLPAAKRVTKTYTQPDVFDIIVLQALANAYVTRDMDSPRTVKFHAAWSLTGFHPGQVLTVTYAKRNLSAVTCLITEVDIVNISGNVVQRQITAVTSSLLPATLRQQFQQTFGTSGGASAAAGVTIITSGGVGGSGTTGKIPKWLSPTTLGDSIVTEAIVGLGIKVTPSYLLHAKQATGTDTIVTFDTTDAFGSRANFISFQYSGTQEGFLGFGNTSGDFFVSNETANNLIFRTSGAEAMRIAAGGNVGINSASPHAKLEVTGASQVAGDGSTHFEISTGTGAYPGTNRMAFGIHDGDYGWIQVVKPGTAYYPLCLNPTSGNVGINTTNPAVFQLEMVGDFGPHTTFSGSIGHLTQKWLTIYAAELHVESLVAQQTIVTMGGRVLIASGANILAVDSGTGTTLSFNYNDLANGDRIVFEGPDTGGSYSIEFMAVTSGPSGTGPYSYTVTRNLDGSGINTWPAGASCMNTGQAGSGFIDMYAIAGLNSTGTGPTIVGNIRNSGTYNDWSPRWAVGNLNGLGAWGGYTYSANLYGAIFGSSSGTWITIETTNGLRMGHSSTVSMQIDTSGNASFVSGGCTINTSGVTLVPATSFSTLFPNTSAYAFTVSSIRKMGLYGYEVSSVNYQRLMTQPGSSGGNITILVDDSPTGSTTTTTSLTLASGSGVSFLDGVSYDQYTLLFSSAQTPASSSNANIWIRATHASGGSGLGIINLDGDQIRVRTGNFFPIVDNSLLCGAHTQAWAAVHSYAYVTEVSMASLKKDIQPTALGRDFLMGLKPVDYRYLTDADDAPRRHGLLKHEVPETFGGHFGRGLEYLQFITPLIAGFQNHEQRIAALEARPA